MAMKLPKVWRDHLKRIGAIGGSKRAEMPEKKRKAIASKAGKAGGQARNAALTPEQRSEIARKAAAARWGKDIK